MPKLMLSALISAADADISRNDSLGQNKYMSETTKSILLAVIGIGAIFGFVYLIASFVANTPVCLKSHKETRHRPQQTHMTTITGMPWVGKGVPISRITPARDYEIDVCDQYE